MSFGTILNNMTLKPIMPVSSVCVRFGTILNN
ncbi:hypothetical protein EB61_01648, partial [Enterococcus faecalis]